MAKGKNFRRRDGYHCDNIWGFKSESVKTTDSVLKRMNKFDIRPKK